MEIGLTAWNNKINLPVGPVSAITKIEYFDTAGAVVVMPPEEYKLFSFNGGLSQFILYLVDSYPDVKLTKKIPYPITITVKAGYTAATMPPDIKRAALLMFSHADTYREDMPLKVNRSALSILRPYKKY